MTTLTRREAFRALGAGAAAVAAASSSAIAAEEVESPPEAVAMLYDTTRCIGCQACVVSCAEVNGLEPDTRLADGLWQMPRDLNAQTKNVIKLYRSETAEVHSFFKKQCMHCLDPACVAGCPFEALTKDETRGIVQWEGSRCIGCRYCEVACPFDIPRFEWDRFNPRIVKCQFCDHALDELGQPGCTKVCPTAAVVFGTREALLHEAHARLAEQPDRYHEDRVYGELDGGGTQVLYLSHVPFSDLGLPDLPRTSIPSYAHGVSKILYRWMLIPLLLWGVMAAFIRKHWKQHEEEAVTYRDRSGLTDQL